MAALPPLPGAPKIRVNSALILGILIGWQILKRIPQKSFEWLLFTLTLLAALWLIQG
jgi:uncharacterized membrane protein YfcA